MRDGAVVVVGIADGESTRARAWWSADGIMWSKATVEKGKGGQLFSVATSIDGFLATGPSGGDSCRGGIWASNDGHAWRCIASGPVFAGFGPYAAAASNLVEVAVGLTDRGWDENSGEAMPGAAWYRTWR